MKKKVLGLALAGVIALSSVLPTVAIATSSTETPKAETTVKTEAPKETTKEKEVETQSLKITRIAGENRYQTAVKASQETFLKGVKYVAIATGENFVDGLVGGALTSQEGFPLLLVRKNSVSKEVLDEIKRLKPEGIFIFGGDAVVSSKVEGEI